MATARDLVGSLRESRDRGQAASGVMVNQSGAPVAPRCLRGRQPTVGRDKAATRAEQSLHKFRFASGFVVSDFC